MYSMEVTFKDEHLDGMEVSTDYDHEYPAGIVKMYRKRMQQIRSALDERDFYNQRSLKFERLKGNRKHQYSMRLNDQMRLILEFKEGNNPYKTIMIVGIEDYH
jgi:proteic killer suppression protein